MTSPPSASRPAHDPRSIHGQVIPKRRFTRWALIYFLQYVCVPVLAIAVLIDGLLYLVFTRLFGGCYAFFCLF